MKKVEQEPQKIGYRIFHKGDRYDVMADSENEAKKIAKNLISKKTKKNG